MLPNSAGQDSDLQDGDASPRRICRKAWEPPGKEPLLREAGATPTRLDPRAEPSTLESRRDVLPRIAPRLPFTFVSGTVSKEIINLIGREEGVGEGGAGSGIPVGILLKPPGDKEAS